MLLFSATYDDEIMDFANAIISNPIVIRLRREEESLDNVKQYYVESKDLEAKFQAFSLLYGTITSGQAMVFCHVCYLSSLLNEHNLPVLSKCILLNESVFVRQEFLIRFKFTNILQ